MPVTSHLVYGSDSKSMGRFLDVDWRNSNAPQERVGGNPNVDILAKNEAASLANGLKP